MGCGVVAGGCYRAVCVSVEGLLQRCEGCWKALEEVVEVCVGGAKLWRVLWKFVHTCLSEFLDPYSAKAKFVFFLDKAVT